MRKSLKLLSVLLGAVMVAGMCLGVGACDPGNSDDGGWDIDPNDRERPITLKFTHMWPEHDETFTKICNDFTVLHPNVKIQKSVKNYSNIDTAISSAWGTSQFPDVCVYWTHSMSTLVNSEVQMAADLTDVYYNENKSSFIKDGECFVSGEINGKIYNVPFRATGFVIYYNKTLMDQLHVAVPTTLEEFETALATIRQNSDLTPLACWGATGTYSYIGGALKVYYDILTGRASDPNYRSDRLEEDDAYWEDQAHISEKFRDWTSKGYFGSNPIAGGTESVENSFLNQTCVMAMLNNNSLAAIQEEMKGVEVGCISVPGFSDMENPEAGFVSGGYDGFFVSNASRNKAWAIEFLKYLNSPEVQQYFCDQEGSIMSRKEVVYSDPLQNQVAQCMSNVGVLGTFRDFTLSTAATASATASGNYTCSKSGSVDQAKAIIKASYESKKESVEDIVLNPQRLSMIAPNYTVNEQARAKYMEWIDHR